MCVCISVYICIYISHLLVEKERKIFLEDNEKNYNNNNNNNNNKEFIINFN